MKVSRRSAKKTIVAFLCSSALLLGACTVEQGSATDVGDKSSAAKASEAPKVNAPKAKCERRRDWRLLHGDTVEENRRTRFKKGLYDQ